MKKMTNRPTNVSLLCAIQAAFATHNNLNRALVGCPNKFWPLSSTVPRYETHTALTAAIMELESPSAERNKDPIWQILLPYTRRDDLRILETAAGAGVHTEHFCRQLIQTGQTFTYQSCDPEDSLLASQRSKICKLDAGANAKILDPLPMTFDAAGIIETSTDAVVPDTSWHVIININMIHISPWSATLGLMAMAARKLVPGGVLVLYGPYRVNGICADSNLQFERWLQAQDSNYGVRELEDVVNAAKVVGLELQSTIEMPANNLSVIMFRT